MPESLEALVERHMAVPFVWGRSDCFLAVADVLVALGHPDPAARYRGLPYGSREEALAVAGDLPATAARELARTGWRDVDPREARLGDVGLRSFTEDGARLWTAGIRLAGAWAWKSERGLILGGRAERAWRRD